MKQWIAIMVALVVLPLASQAQGLDTSDGNAKAQADALVTKGAALGQKGHFEQAVAMFREAHRIYPRAIHHCNIGLAYRLWKRWSRAHLYLQHCQTQSKAALPGWVAREQRLVLSKLKSADYVPVNVTVDPEHARVLLPGTVRKERLVAPLKAWLPVGEHVLSVVAKGYLAKSLNLRIRPDTPIATHVALTPMTLVNRSTAFEQEIRRNGFPIDIYASYDSGYSGDSASNVSSWAVLSGGVLAAGLGAVFHGLAASRRSKIEGMTAGYDTDTELEAFELERGVALSLYAVGAVITGVGTYLLTGNSH